MHDMPFEAPFYFDSILNPPVVPPINSNFAYELQYGRPSIYSPAYTPPIPPAPPSVNMPHALPPKMSTQAPAIAQQTALPPATSNAQRSLINEALGPMMQPVMSRMMSPNPGRMTRGQHEQAIRRNAMFDDNRAINAMGGEATRRAQMYEARANATTAMTNARAATQAAQNQYNAARAGQEQSATTTLSDGTVVNDQGTFGSPNRTYTATLPGGQKETISPADYRGLLQMEGNHTQRGAQIAAADQAAAQQARRAQMDRNISIQNNPAARQYATDAGTISRQSDNQRLADQQLQLLEQARRRQQLAAAGR